ncbi:Alcohol dehydrogenase superfamily zinc-type [Penicillium robsamsonii]|uniref:Alcohol dehydrogenase superfamily zinc-type n=1 Tax=Penicillium robsamsonii TaxID=1792511 RepID=UPI002548C76D|nr:Alcohol dehydrogenase superfamily zinc-type [Penicillium robsamsonii]KAJ5827803.1 Alcohol dehydrogenase superfamily zinc-type [Penicillium robsamsonii]
MPSAELSWPERQTAIIANATGDLVVSQDVQLPELEPDMLIVKTVVVAVNPCDMKMTGPMASEGAISGGDCAGIVIAIGSEVPEGRFAVGDRVCVAVQSMNPLLPRVGAFAQYVGATADFTLKIPDDMTFEEASTLGISTATIGYALFKSLNIPGHPDKPAAKPAYVLVYGGSTATGTIAIQLIRRSGLIPITTCSPKNFPLVERRGAEKAFDYHDADSVKEIKAYTKNALYYALDCFCDSTSMRFCYSVLGRAGGRYTTLEYYNTELHSRKTVKPDWILGVALFGKKVGWKEPYNLEGDPELRTFGKVWFMTVQRMLDAGEIKPHPTKLSGTTFEHVIEGVDLIRQKAVSGQKLVYHIADP